MGVLPAMFGRITPDLANNVNIFRANQEIPAWSLINNYRWQNPKFPHGTPPLLHGIRYYAEGDYNRGDKSHTFDVQKTGARLFKKP